MSLVCGVQRWDMQTQTARRELATGGRGGGTWREHNIQPQFGWGAAAVGWGALSAIHRSGIQKFVFQPWVVLLPRITSVHLVKH